MRVIWLETIGWVGSGLIVWSLMQARVLRFRWMNLIGSVIATGYNVWLGIWPFAAMNAIIAVINVYWLMRLYREAHDESVFEVVEVAPGDAYFAHVLRVHAKDIASYHPRFTPKTPSAAYLVVRGDETVGAVVLSTQHDGVAHVELDWVTPRFRDFSPGEFVYRQSGVFAEHGIRRVVWDQPAASSVDYLKRVGFAPESDNRWSRAVA